MLLNTAVRVFQNPTGQGNVPGTAFADLASCCEELTFLFIPTHENWKITSFVTSYFHINVPEDIPAVVGVPPEVVQLLVVLVVPKWIEGERFKGLYV